MAAKDDKQEELKAMGGPLWCRLQPLLLSPDFLNGLVCQVCLKPSQKIPSWRKAMSML